MKTKLMAVVAAAAAMFVGNLRADLTRYTEKVDGWTWEYEVAEGKAQNVIGQFKTKYYSNPGPNLVIPAKLGGKAVASLGLYALQGYDFTTVTIPSTVTRIGHRAFGGCRYLRSAKLPDSVKEIAYNAFEDCVNLQCVDFGKNVSFIGEKAFSGCSSLRSLVFRGANAPNVVVNQHTGEVDAFDGVAEGCKVYVPVKAKGWPIDDKVWQGLPLFAGDCMVKVNVDVYDGGGEHGKVSGGGEFAVGKKITIKGTPNKGCLCAGWNDDATGVYYGHSATLSYVVTGADTDFRTGFVQSNVAEDYLYVDSLYEQYDAEDDGTVYVPVGVRSLSEPKVTVKGLPSGVKFDAAKMVLAGKATKPGVYNIKVSATNKSTKDPKTVEFELCVPNFKDELIELDDMYGWCLPGAAYVETIASADGCKVTGLPSGLKWTAKDIVDKNCGNVPANSIYGAPTKPGQYTVFFTKTDGDKVKVKHTATATFIVLPFKKVEVEMVGNSGKDKVTGAGEYAVGKKVTLKATADKGKVFAGWYLDEECTSPFSPSASVQIEMPLIGEVKFYAKFITADEDASNVSAAIVLGDHEQLLSKDEPEQIEERCGVMVWHPLFVTSSSGDTTVSTVKVSGLPAGLKFTANEIVDKAFSAYPIPANAIYGYPTTPSKAKTPSSVKVTVTTAGKTKVEYGVDVLVVPREEWAAGSYSGGNGHSQASVTITDAGKLSGKWIQNGRTLTLSTPGFDSYDADNQIYNLYIETKSSHGSDHGEKGVAPIEAELHSDGVIRFKNGSAVDLYRNTDWKSATWKPIAAKFAKAAALTHDMENVGDKYGFSLKFAASGSVTVKCNYLYAGATKPYAASGSAVLVATCDPDKDESFDGFVHVGLQGKSDKFPGFFGRFYVHWDGEKFTVTKVEAINEEE